MRQADAGRVRGSTTAKIWFIEAADFQCPVCKEWHDKEYAAIDREYVATGKVRFAFMNYPLPQHQWAHLAAEAAMCASSQNKFWSMQDLLFAHQSDWVTSPTPRARLEEFASQAGVNVTSWRACVDSGSVSALVDADRDRARASGAAATPTFFIGQERVSGLIPLEQLRAIISRELATK